MNADEHRALAEKNLSAAHNQAQSIAASEFPDRETLGLIRSNMAIAHALLAGTHHPNHQIGDERG